MKINLIIDGNYLMQKSVFILFKLRTLYTDLPVILERDYYNLKLQEKYGEGGIRTLGPSCPGQLLSREL